VRPKTIGNRGQVLANLRASEVETVRLLLAHRADTTPTAPAVLSEGGATLTYRALGELVTRTADQFATIGLGRNDRVAVVLPNGPSMAVAALAVACASICAPLNPTYSATELEFYLRDLGARALVLGRDDPSPARRVARALGVTVLELITAQSGSRPDLFVDVLDARTECTSEQCQMQSTPPHPGDVAIVLHTSGTTSRPKIVPLTHHNLCASAHNVAAALRLTPHDRCLNVMPLFHIHGLVAGLLASLSAGASVICASGYREDTFLDWLRNLGPTWYTAVPTIHQGVLAKLAKTTDGVRGHQLRFIRSSSSALPPTVMAALESTFGCPVIEAYGMTEAAHQMASNPLPPLARKEGSVGLAAGPEVAVVDEAGNLLAPGARGEVVIRGPNVTPGYASNPEANAKAFTNGWFRTGDEGYFDSDDYLFLTGRLKEIINRGGEKIAPREIDEALLEHPGVAQAVAFGVPHPTLGEDVAAAVVLRPEASLGEAELREFLFARLADFKVPSQVVVLDRIPKGPTGKIQRIGLAEKLADRLQGGAYVPPRTALEAVVAAVYAEVLSIDRVGTLDNFFSLGGDSLKATQVVSRLQAVLPVSIPIVTVFRKASVSELADALTSLLSSEDRARLDESLATEGLEAVRAGFGRSLASDSDGGIDPIPRRGERSGS
jgi:oxalate---CoA ligase